MTDTKTIPVDIYTEMTPNPASLKFVMNRMLLPGRSVDYRTEADSGDSPLGKGLFGFPFVDGVFIANNFVTVTKAEGSQWEEIIPSVKQYLREFIQTGQDPVTNLPQTTSADGETGDDAISAKIKELLDNYVRPAVEQDGGAIQFKSFDDGIVTLIMQGSCSGCPSSMITLKSGIEGLLKRMVPEVEEVVAEEG